MTLADDRVIQSSALILAPGLGYYVYRPAEYDQMPPELVSHTVDHTSFDRFAGKQVVVIGGGQSALETAALAREKAALTYSWSLDALSSGFKVSAPQNVARHLSDSAIPKQEAAIAGLAGA